VTRYWQQAHPEAFMRGFRDFTRFYGMLIDTMEYRYINGFAYNTARPVAEEEIPQRFQRAEEVFPGKLWREQLSDWDETIKPAAIKAHRELQSVDPDGLSDEELVEYLARCREHHAVMISQHMRFTAAVLPTGTSRHTSETDERPAAELLGLMPKRPRIGRSVAGSGAFVAAFQADLPARDPRVGRRPPVLEALRSLEGGTGAAMSAYLDLVGYRLLDGFDISEPYALELPDVLLRAIRVAVAGRGLETSDVDDRIADVRSKVPEEHRTEFDELLGEARLTYRLRDERGVFSDIWASGLMRRAVLAGGRRLAAAGRIHDPADPLTSTRCARCSPKGRTSAEELAARFEYRARTARRMPHASRRPGLTRLPTRPACRPASHGSIRHRDLARPPVRQLQAEHEGTSAVVWRQARAYRREWHAHR
jgi:pyruvate,water dikinase